MIAAPFCIGFGCAPHFSGRDDQCLIQQASFIEIGEQSGAGLIEGGQQVALDIITVAVGVQLYPSTQS